MKKETKNLVITAIIALAAGLILGSWLSTTRAQGQTASQEKLPDAVLNLMTQSGEVIMLNGDNGYQGVAGYYAPNSEGLMSRLALIIFKDNKVSSYDMVPVISASGSKFSTQDADYVLWESKGDFLFYQGDAEILLSTLKSVPLLTGK